ncbi:MAG: ABC transporter ATP-binding protein [Hyphomicrobiaceae bacterium]
MSADNQTGSGPAQSPSIDERHGLKVGKGDAPAVTVHVRGVRFAWPGANAFSLAIDDFSVRKGERILLLGPSGSGKSTLLSLLAGIAAPAQGAIEILGTDIARLSSARRDRFRAEHCGIIFQMFNLLPYGSVADNVLLPLSFASARRERAGTTRTALEAEVARLLARLGLEGSDVGRRRAASLSVGQQQRVAAARALIGRPELIIADEPTSALDRNRQEAFLDLLFGELDAAGSSLVMVSHEERFTGRFDRIVSLSDVARTAAERTTA